MPKTDLARDGRGGPRPGAGRPKLKAGEYRRSITIRLPAALLEQLPATERGQWIEIAIREKLRADQQAQPLTMVR